MKKQIGIFTAILFAVSTLMVSCSPEIHEHTFAEEWSSDETSHWHAATCGCSDVELQKTEHTFGKWEVIKEATEEAEGNKERVCDVCKYKETAEIDQLNHKHVTGESWKTDDKNHWKECTGCKEKLERAEHECEWTVTKEATCTEEGTKTGTCKVCKKEVTEKIDAKGHSYSESWTKDASGHWYECVCGAKKDFEDHTYDIRKVLQESTCTQEGKKTVYCTVCKYEKEETIPAKGHSGIWEITNEPTETAVGQMQSVCEVCGETETKDLQPAPEGFRFVEAGSFQMGSNKGYSDNKPVHEVTITKPFYMGKYEVTQAEYEVYCSYGSSSPSSSYGDGDNYPAYYVSWYDALVYCNKRSMAEELTPCYSISDSTDPKDWGEVPTSSDSTWNAVECNWNANGYRLPTEAEWEYAARAGDNTVESLTYSGTSDVNKLGDYAWYYDSANDNTHEVGTKLPNAFGLYDMSGNVWEWCWNWYTNSYDTEAEGGSDPTGSSAGAYRVYRGGSWDFYSVGCAVSFRRSYYPNYLNYYLGFRVVRQAN